MGSTSSKRTVGSSLLAAVFAGGAIAACGLDVVGISPPSPPVEGDASPSLPPSDEAGPPPDGSTIDAKPPETCPWPALQRDSPWPMIGGCVGHPGRTVHRGPKNKPQILWTVKITTRETQIVIGADGTVYVPANTEGVVAFGPDGQRRPFADAGTGVPNNVTNAPSIGVDGTLYFGAEHEVVAHGNDGTRWRARTGGEIDTSTLVDLDGTVYAGSFDDSFYAFAPDGGVRWKVGLGGDVWASAALGPDGGIYVGAKDKLFALERDGGRSWEFTTTGEIQSSPVVADDGTIYVGTIGNRLHAVNPDGGAKWVVQTTTGFGWQQLPALGSDGTVFAATGKQLAAIAPDDGGTRWEHDVGASLRTSVVVDADGDLYVGGDGKMFGYTADGKELWSLDIGANASGFAIGKDGTIFVACNGDTLLAIRE